MKKFWALALLLPSLAIAAADNRGGRTFNYEVAIPGDATKQLVSVKEGSTEEIVLFDKVTVYPKFATTISKRYWDTLVSAGRVPEHDEVHCAKKNCTYIVKGQVREERRLVLSIDAKANPVATTIAYSESRTVPELEQVIKTGPVVNTRAWVDKKVFEVGQTFEIGYAEEINGTKVKLVSVDE